MSYVVAALYHFFDFPHFAETRAGLLAFLKENEVRGSILISAEGINGTVCGTRTGIDNMLQYLRQHIVKGNFEHKESYHEKQAFRRSKVRLKKETISMGEECPLDMVGEYIDPQDWNKLIADPDTIVIDTRNVYETHLGTFERAIDPNIKTFKELPAYVRENLDDKKETKLATFCTGGIRCEKFTSWLRSKGYEKVYHLKGGILKYLEEIPPEQSLWKGECFVFDGRVSVGHGLTPSKTNTMCFKCGNPLTPEDRQHPDYIENVHCAYCPKPLVPAKT